MCEVQRRNRRLADIGVDMSGQAAEPGFDGVHCLAHTGEIPPLDHLLDLPQPLIGDARVIIPDGDSGGDEGLPN